MADVDDTRGRTAVLEERHVEFCEGILAGKSLRQAYLDAGFEPGSPMLAGQSARELLEREHVQMYMATRRMELQARARLEPDRVIEELSLIAFRDPAEFLSEEIRGPQDILKLPEHVRRTITGWKYDRWENFVVEFADKKSALDSLAKIAGLFQRDRVNDQDRRDGEALLRTAFWKYVMALHVHENITIGEAVSRAQNEPDKVEAWARAKGLLGPATDEVVIE